MIWIATAILMLLFLGIIAVRDEIQDWGNGNAPCGTSWKQFDTDSQGGRGYACNCHIDHKIWISWPFVDKRR